MKKNSLKTVLIIVVFFFSTSIMAQERGIKELDFLIGTWETREDNVEKGWWETATREIKFVLRDNYMELKSKSIDSNGKEREYSWYINYNKESEQFEMVSMFSNWHKTQFDILSWDSKNRRLIIRNKPHFENEFHERFGEIVFNENFDGYTWIGENKHGDEDDPSIWRYVEKGVRIK